MATYNLQLTVKAQPAQSVLPDQAYLYHDAVFDALGVAMESGGNANEEPYAGSPAPVFNTLFLWESGCRFNESWNCTRACLDPYIGPGMVWSAADAMFTLHNCLLYPLLANSSFHGWLVEDPPGLLDTFGISALDLTGDEGFKAWGANVSTLPVVQDCITAMCDLVYDEPSLSVCSEPSGLGWLSWSTAYGVGPTDDLGSIDHLWRPVIVRLPREH